MYNLDPNKQYPTRTESKAIIRFQDCDPLKHLNNSKYFDYFFNAREDQTSSLYGSNSGTPFDELSSSWVVYQQQIAYIRSALVSERVTILSSLIYFNDNTIVEEYIMTDDAKQQLKAVLWTTCKYIDIQTGRTRPHHPQVTQYLQTICDATVAYEGVSFNERIKTIKKEILEGRF